MKTKEQMQAIVDELREVCKKHGVALIGGCSGEDLFGEISIIELEDCTPYMLTMLTNTVEHSEREGYFTEGIGK